MSAELTGFLLVDKPSGPTSYDVIRHVKRVLPKVKLGHTGTLDPLASGLLILLFGKATRMQSGFMSLSKTYWCRMKLGKKTDTGDRMGQTVDEKIVPPLTESNISAALNKFIGQQSQIPPMYSALKVGGTPLYKLARQGQSVEREARTIHIYSMEYLGFENSEIEFRVHCSSGTYVRTLVEDIGERLGTCSTVVELRRERIGDYPVEQAVTLVQIDKLSPAEWISTLRVSR